MQAKLAMLAIVPCSGHIYHANYGSYVRVMRPFAAWEIDRFCTRPPTWVAVTRRGTFMHVVAAHDLDDLRAKLEKAVAEHSETGRSVG